MASITSALNLNLSKSYISPSSTSQLQHRSISRHEVSTTIRHKAAFKRNATNFQTKALGGDATATTAPPLSSQSIIQEMISTNRVLKSHISKMAVVELRNECTLLGLPTDGLKYDLVLRLLTWATEQAAIQHSSSNDASNSNGYSSSGSDGYGDEPPTRKVGRPIKSEAERAASEEEKRLAKTIASSAATTTSNERNNFPSSAAPTTTGPKVEYAPPNATGAEVKVQWLGTSSGAPTSRRNVSCIALRHLDRIFLVDCGEGTRNQLRSANLNTAKISHIFITHLHGDHCFGIPGTLAAIAAARVGTPLASEPINVYGPPELHRLMLASFKAAGLQLSTPVIVKTWVFDSAKEMTPSAVDPAGQLLLGTQAPDQAGVVPAETARTWQSVYDNGTDQVVRQGLTWSTTLPNGWTVTAAQLQHRMPCWGYVFEEPAAVVKSNIVPRRRHEDGASSGSEGEAEEDTVNINNTVNSESDGDGDIVENENENEKWIRPGRKIVLLGDTCDSSAILDIARGCDVLSHEATFQVGMEEKAAVATHSTSEQAGLFAKQVRAKNLVLTHFSGRYEQADKYKKVWIEAKQQGKSMKDMHVSNVVPLAEEARAAAGGSKVFLANDFYAFKVNIPNPVPERMFLDMKKRQQQNLMRRLESQQRQSQNRSNGSGGAGGGNGGERDPYNERYNSGSNDNRRENNYNSGNSGSNGGGMRREYQQQRPQYQDGASSSPSGRRSPPRNSNYAGGQRRTGGGGGGSGGSGSGY